VPHITYEDAALLYGTDKPDLRNPILISDVSDVFAREDVAFKAFKAKTVRAIPAPGAASQPRSFFDRLNDWARSEGAAGLGYIQLDTDGGKIVGKGPIAKFLSDEAMAALVAKAGVKAGDAVFFSADAKTDRAAKIAGLARTRIGTELKLIEQDCFKFCWIVDMPMYEWNEDEKRIDFGHNPFSLPQYDRERFMTLNADASLNQDDREEILGIKVFQYDIVCNGYEMLSGAVRNRDPEVMLKAFELAGSGRDFTEAKFGGMLNAFRHGAPPHGGCAVGLERVVMLLAGEENIREVTMFPMNQQGQDLLMNAPTEVLPKQLRELHIRVVQPEKA
jgi:aspartyl-tRNA synthetase